MKCPYCGEEMIDTAKFCANCGMAKPVEGETVEAAPETEQNAQEQTIQEQAVLEESVQDEPQEYHYGGHTSGGFAEPHKQTQQKQQTQNCGLGIASLVLGIIGAVFAGVICGVLAIVFSRMAKARDGKTGMNTAGLVLGIIAIAKIVLVILCVVILGVTYYNTILDFNNVLDNADNLAMLFMMFPC